MLDGFIFWLSCIFILIKVTEIILNFELCLISLTSEVNLVELVQGSLMILGSIVIGFNYLHLSLLYRYT